MGGACSTYGIEYKLIQSFNWPAWREDYLEDPGIYGRIILKSIINEPYKNVHNGLYWLRVQAGAGFLRTCLWNTVHLATRINFSKGLCFTEIVELVGNGLLYGDLHKFSYADWGKNHKFLTATTGLLAEIRTRDLEKHETYMLITGSQRSVAKHYRGDLNKPWENSCACGMLTILNCEQSVGTLQVLLAFWYSWPGWWQDGTAASLPRMAAGRHSKP